MSKRKTNRADLARFMQNCLIWLGQPRWQVMVLKERDQQPGDKDDVWAETRYGGQRYTCELWISDHIVNEADADLQRQVMVHEALHSIHSGIDRVLWGASDLMHDHEHDALFGRYHTQRELMVDALSMAVMDVPEIKRLWRES